jgi:hypothetical protein
MWLLTVDRASGRCQLDGYVAELEAVWLAVDELYGSLSPSGLVKLPRFPQPGPNQPITLRTGS